MTQEEQQLLLKVICGMLPYEVKANVTLFNKNRLCVITGVSLNRSTGLYSIEIRKQNRELQNIRWPTNAIKPYLRPMTSMTEEEDNEYELTFDNVVVYSGHNNNNIHSEHRATYETFDYLNSHHFDYRRLIEKGLALEAKEGMYNN